MTQLKQATKVLSACVVALGLYFLSITLGRKAGASPWLTGVTVVAIISSVVTAAKFSKRDRIDQVQNLMFSGGLVALTAAGILNEYVRNFFAPSFLFVLLALFPGLLLAAYRAFIEKRARM